MRAPTISSSVLADRLRRLVDAGIIETDPNGTYVLTERSEGLGPALESLKTRSEGWAATQPSDVR